MLAHPHTGDSGSHHGPADWRTSTPPAPLFMPTLYALSCLLLSIAALQFHKDPHLQVPTPISLLGSAASVASIGMLIAGFFIASWWAPVVMFIAGPAAFSMIPAHIRRSYWDLILVGGALGGMGLGLAALFG